MREVLGLREILPRQTEVASVISRDGVPWFRSLTIDRGSRSGVTLNAPVMSPTGVVMQTPPPAGNTELTASAEINLQALFPLPTAN